MTGAARTLDKVEEKARVHNRGSRNLSMSNPLISEAAKFGEAKRKHGQSKDMDTSEGWYAGKEKADKESAEKQAAADTQAAEQAQRAAAEARDKAATEASHEAQRKALKRKGRRASILTGPGGVDENKLGNVGGGV